MREFKKLKNAFPACYEASEMRLSVNGEEVPVIKYVGLYDHANFSVEGEAEVTITAPNQVKLEGRRQNL